MIDINQIKQNQAWGTVTQDNIFLTDLLDEGEELSHPFHDINAMAFPSRGTKHLAVF